MAFGHSIAREHVNSLNLNEQMNDEKGAKVLGVEDRAHAPSVVVAIDVMGIWNTHIIMKPKVYTHPTNVVSTNEYQPLCSL